jgi:hypothetical protein
VAGVNTRVPTHVDTGRDGGYRGRVDAIGILILGSAIGFIGSTLGTIIVDHLALQRQAPAELVREVLWRLPHHDVDTRRCGLELLIRNAALLTARERRVSLRLVRLCSSCWWSICGPTPSGWGGQGRPSLRAGR